MNGNNFPRGYLSAVFPGTHDAADTGAGRANYGRRRFLLKGKIHLVILSLLVFFGSVCSLYGTDLVIVQSSDLEPYNEAVEGLYDALDLVRPTHGPKSMLGFTVERLLLDGADDDAGFRRLIQDRRPAVLIAVGRRALEVAREIDDLPIVHVMVPNAGQLIGERTRITGVSMVVPPFTSLQKLHAYFPHVRRVLVLYHPLTSERFIAEAHKAAELLRYELRAVPVEISEDVPRILSSLPYKVEAVWMIPDPVVLNAQTVQAYLDYTMREKVILLTFAEKYLKIGAAFAVVADNRDMGREAALLAQQLLAGKNIRELPDHPPVAFRILQNQEMLTRVAALKQQYSQP